MTKNKIAIIGDVHGKLELVHKIMEEAKDVSVFLQVGDLADVLAESKPYGASYDKKYKKPLYFIAGNHETWDLLEEHENTDHDHKGCKIRYEDTFVENLFYIPRGDYVDISPHNIRVAGLGGNYAPSRYYRKRSELHHDRRRHYVEDDVNRCMDTPGSVDILLTHEAPTPFKSFKRTNKANEGEEMGRREIRMLLQRIKPQYHFFGHHHLATDRIYTWGNSFLGDGFLMSFCLPMAYIGYIVLETERMKYEWRWICVEKKRKVNSMLMERL